jgi:hypothetical protein
VFTADFFVPLSQTRMPRFTSLKKKGRCEKRFGAASQLVLANSRLLCGKWVNGYWPPIFLFQIRERLWGVWLESSPAFLLRHPEPNVEKYSPAPCLGGGEGLVFSLKWVLGRKQS